MERYRGLIVAGTGWRWVVVLLLALTVSALEAIGAVLIYTLVALATDAGTGIELPLVGDLQALLPGVAPDQLTTYTAIGVAVFFVVRGATVLLQTYVQMRVATSAATALSVRLLNQYLRLPYAFHLRRNSAELIRNAHESVMQILDEVMVPFVRLLAELTMVTGLVTVLLVTAPAATAIAAIVLVPSVALLLRSVQPRVGHLGATNQREAARSIQLLQHSLHGYRDITVLGRQEHFTGAYHRSRQILARTRYLHTILADLPRVAIEALTVGLVAVFIVVSTATDDGAGSVAVVGLFAYAALRIMPALHKITLNLNNIRFGRAALDDVQADLRRPVPPPAPTVEPLPFRHRLVLEGVGFTYEGNDTPTLEGIDLVVERGRSTGIVGVTGAGKSTLVDLMVGLSTPTVGRLTIDGHDMAGNESRWQRDLGMVSQQVFLTDDTLRHNIALGVPEEEIDEDRLREAVRLAQLEEFVDHLPDGLETWVGERGVRVSGGQRQRVAIARALYPGPQVLFFDEGTSALDNATEAALIEALAGLQRDHTIVTIAHRLSTVRDHDQIVFLRDGRIDDLGTYTELLARNDAFRSLARESHVT